VTEGYLQFGETKRGWMRWEE